MIWCWVEWKSAAFAVALQARESRSWLQVRTRRTRLPFKQCLSCRSEPIVEIDTSLLKACSVYHSIVVSSLFDLSSCSLCIINSRETFTKLLFTLKLKCLLVKMVSNWNASNNSNPFQVFNVEVCVCVCLLLNTTR